MSSRTAHWLMLVVAVATARTALSQIAPTIQKPIATARAAAAAANDRNQESDLVALVGRK